MISEIFLKYLRKPLKSEIFGIINTRFDLSYIDKNIRFRFRSEW